MSINRIIGIIGTSVGGGLLGAGIQRTYMLGNKISSGFSKLMGKGQYKFDNLTWEFLIIGAVLLVIGIFFSLRKK